MRRRLLDLLGSPRTYWILLALYALVTGAVLLSGEGGGGGDTHTYLALATGILNGSYSMYWYLDPPIPDTFRTPGYPLFLSVILALFGTWKAVRFVQIALFLLSIHLCFRLLGRWVKGYAPRNLFLLLLIPSQNITPHVVAVSPEVPAILCLCALLLLGPREGRSSIWSAIVSGLLAGVVFQCRPVFLLFPLVLVGVEAFLLRGATPWRSRLLMLTVYASTLLPFALWNRSHHGVFSATPLEGGGGVFHQGWWAGRLPGYHQWRYWGNSFADEMIRFVPPDSVPANIAAYEREWDTLDARLAPFITEGDRVMLEHYEEYVNEKSYSAGFTRERDRLLTEFTKRHMMEELSYTLAYKAYSTVRLWVIGVDRGDFVRAGWKGKFARVAPFLVTLLLFLLAAVCLPLAHARGLLRLREFYPMAVVVLYCWLIHVPFAIQSRYTVPVRLVLYVYLALVLYALLSGRKLTLNDGEPGRSPLGSAS